MAYQTRGRDPLLDSKMAEAIEKRGKELLGVGLIVLGLMAAMMIGSYTPDDPNWMVSTDAPAQNWLGRMGASLAAPLFMIVGWGAWAVAAILLAWGARFALHRGADRAMGRLIFAPIAVALCAIYGATLTPDAEWLQTHSFGLGGLFGDTVMGAILTILPFGSTFTIKMMSLLMGGAILALGAFVMGFTKVELNRIFRFMLVGVIMVYAGIMNVLGRGASGAVVAAQGLQARQSERRARNRIEAEENAEFAASHAYYDDEMPAHAPVAAPKTGLLAKMPALVKRTEPMPEPELVEDWFDAEIDQAPSDDRIKSKIADVIKNRVRTASAVHAPVTSPLTRGRGRGPDPLVLDTTPRSHLREEPPLTGAARAEPPLTASRLSINPAKPAQPVPQPEIATDNIFVENDVLPLEDAAVDDAIHIPVAAPRKVVQQPIRKAIQPSKKAQAEAQPGLTFEDTHPGFELPPLNLLESPDVVERLHLSDEALEENARMLENVLDDYGVKGEIVAVRPGPVVTKPTLKIRLPTLSECMVKMIA